MELLQNIMVYVVLLTLLLSLMALSYSEDKIKKQKKKLNREVEINEQQADTIKRLNCSLDESYVAIEAVANTKKKADRIKLANKYTYND